jgi:hypothetical protein
METPPPLPAFFNGSHGGSASLISLTTTMGVFAGSIFGPRAAHGHQLPPIISAPSALPPHH